MHRHARRMEDSLWASTNARRWLFGLPPTPFVCLRGPYPLGDYLFPQPLRSASLASTSTHVSVEIVEVVTDEEIVDYIEARTFALRSPTFQRSRFAPEVGRRCLGIEPWGVAV